MMHWRYESVALPLEKNVPYLGGIALSADDYHAHIVAGFAQMYRFLMANKDGLLAPGGPLTALQEQQVRFLFRPTSIYGAILHNAWRPECLQHGVDYSIALDRLSYAFVVAPDKPHVWPILHAELRAMEQLDIPFFTVSTAGDALCVGAHQVVRHYFRELSYQQVLSQVHALDEADLSRQVAIIQSAFYAKGAQTARQESGQWGLEPVPWLSAEQLLEEAGAIAAALETKAIPDPDGSVNWIGLGYEPRAERFQLQVLNDSLYDGRCGVALFLAAFSQRAGEPRCRDLALRTLQSLRRQIHTYDPESQQRIARLVGIGGATGLGAMIYTFVRVSQFLREDLLPEAQALAHWMTPECIAADMQLDIISGAAGAILGLLSLYGVTGDATALEKAVACGQHLLAHRVSYAGTPRAWQTVGTQPLTGFSHGAAGIAYALLRLHAATRDCQYLEAALEGMEYERSVFSASHANWPDFRRAGQTEQPLFLSQWCNGAAGIGLARLGSLDVVSTPEMEREITVALDTTQRDVLQAVDHVCCGNLGRVEALFIGAQRCPRADWYQVAFQSAMRVVARARHTGAYQLFANLPHGVCNPGFFQGTAGIGYQLLRLARPEQVPSVLLWE
jgi:type 2 lantibiotic biosynthesis protein LanM